jgi:hypothetical protein
MRISDFESIRKIAAEQQNFTIPPLYVLWLLQRIKGDICLVAETGGGALQAYLLAVPVDNSASSILVWQLASTAPLAQSTAVNTLIDFFDGLCKAAHVELLFFTAVPDSSTFRTLRRHIAATWKTEPLRTTDLHELVAPGEVEFVVKLR